LPPAQKLKTLTTQQATVNQDEKLVEADILAGKCGTLDGCFALGTQLWTPDGFRVVEEILAGEYLFARNEFDYRGAIVPKLVEEKFERIGRILHLHVSGQIIRTTPEHRFHECTKGWVQAGALSAGDRVFAADVWKTIDDVFDTGEYETVINFRVADYHTYFVGGESWGWVLWAHNDYRQLATVLANAPDVGAASGQVLLGIAGQMPQGQTAQQMSLPAFQGILETKLINKGLLKSGNHLSTETVNSAKEAAEVHGNTGRSPTITFNPSAPNPYTSGSIAYNQYNAMQALNTAYPTVNALRLWLQLPGGVNYGRNAGLAYELSRAQYYAAQGQLVDVEHPTQSSAGSGEVDLLLTGNQIVDAKAWSQQMWRNASIKKRAGMIRQLQTEIAKYLADPTGYSLRLEFKYAIPAEVLAALQTLVAANPSYVARLSWAANVN
jgi:hypothetical protein